MIENHTKKYSTSSPVIIFAFIVATGLGLLGVWSSPNTNSFNFQPFAYLALMYVILVDLKFGIYAVISNGKFSQVFHFFYHSSIEVTEIGRIAYMPTWAIGHKHRSVYILNKNTNKVVTKMANTAYSPRKLAEIVHVLKELNPTIELDGDTKALLNRYNL